MLYINKRVLALFHHSISSSLPAGHRLLRQAPSAVLPSPPAGPIVQPIAQPSRRLLQPGPGRLVPLPPLLQPPHPIRIDQSGVDAQEAVHLRAVPALEVGEDVLGVAVVGAEHAVIAGEGGGADGEEPDGPGGLGGEDHLFVVVVIYCGLACRYFSRPSTNELGRSWMILFAFALASSSDPFCFSYRYDRLRWFGRPLRLSGANSFRTCAGMLMP